MNFKQRSTLSYAKLSLEETLSVLQASQEGLKESDIFERRKTFGLNEREVPKASSLWLFFSRYSGPMPWMLESAMILSFLLGRNVEGVLIFLLLTMNACMGFFHERHAQKAVELIQKKLAFRARVLRDGAWVLIETKELVPGDILLLKLGDSVPADVKVIGGAIAVDESLLTGESLPRESHPSDIVYCGSLIKRGETRAVVVNIGDNTSFGKTMELARHAKSKSHQEEVMLAIVQYMMYGGIGASLLVALYAFFFHVPFLLIATFAVTFLMGAIPVALPAVLTIVQAAAARQLAKKNILVTRLDSVEDAASIDILCLDKTGTLTMNVLSIAEVVPFEGYSREDVVLFAMLSSEERGLDPIDRAILSYGKTHMFVPTVESYTRISFLPFDPSLKRTEALVEKEGKRFMVFKGSVRMIQNLCEGRTAGAFEQANSVLQRFSEKGYRTLAVAYAAADGGRAFRMVGLLSLADAPRRSAHVMISEIKALGVKPLMLTGDNVAIAREIAKQVGIGRCIVRMSDLESLSEVEQRDMASRCDGFAEVFPEDKYRIVRLLQSAGHAVGMTGDGTNDAPALKQAEMGIAVSSATDAAKASASVVLTQEGLHVLVDAIKISRETYQRMLSWVINKETKVIEVVGLLLIGFFWFHKMVLSLFDMSLLIVANDFITMSLATDRVKHSSSPNIWDVKTLTLASLFLGLMMMVGGAFMLFGGIYLLHLPFEQVRTLILLYLVFDSQLRILVVRERNHFWSSRPGTGLLLCTAVTAVIFLFLGIAGILFPPLPVSHVLLTFAFASLFTLACDFPKYYLFRKLGM